MGKLGEFKGQIVHSGVHPGLPNQQIPLWESSSNFIFRDNSAKIAAPHQALFERLSGLPGTGILPLDNDGVPALVWGTREALYLGRTPPDAVDVTRASGAYTGDDDDLWSFVQFGSSLLATNGVDAVQYKADINNDNDFVDIDTVSDLAVSFRCDILKGTGAFILAFSTDNIDTEYRWCDEDNVLLWTPNAANKARDQNIREMKSSIMAVTQLGNLLIVHGRNQNYVTGFAGAPIYFPFEHLLNGIGAVGKYSVTLVGRQLFGFGPNGIYVVDGTTFKYIDDPSMHKHVFEDTYDKERHKEVVTWSDENESIAYFSYPLLAGGGATVGFNYRTGAWSMYEWYRTAADSGGLWNHPVMVDVYGQTWLQSPSSAAFTSLGNPLGISDSLLLNSGYGEGGYGEGGYGGQWEGID